MTLNWSEWTEGEFPKTTCQIDNLTATVQLCNVNEATGWGNRQWAVVNRDGAVLGTGYTLGSFNAMKLCETVMTIWGVIQPAHDMGRINAIHWDSPRKA